MEADWVKKEQKNKVKNYARTHQQRGDTKNIGAWGKPLRHAGRNDRKSKSDFFPDSFRRHEPGSQNLIIGFLWI